MGRLGSVVRGGSFLALMTVTATGCMATRKYVRHEVKGTSDVLTAKINTAEGQIKETQDSVKSVNDKVVGVDQRVTGVDQRVAGVDQKLTGVDQKVTGVNGKVDELDGKTTQGLNGLHGDVRNVDAKAEKAATNVQILDTKFSNRNNFAVSSQKSVQFGLNSATLTPASKASLDEIAALLQKDPDALVVLEGHTDSTGDRDYNVSLGERRTEAVRRYLAVDKGVPVFKIEQISFGADKPIAPNTSKQGREQNRSVTLSLMVPAMPTSTASLSK